MNVFSNVAIAPQIMFVNTLNSIFNSSA